MSSTPFGATEFMFKRVAATTYTFSGSQYFLSGSRVTSTSVKIYEQGVLNLESTTSDTGPGASIPSTKMCSGAICTSDSTAATFSAMTSKFFCWGGSLNDAQHAQLFAAVQAYQVALGRSSV